jgi:thiol-disulfide isomerase/thioredoxin
MGACPSKALRPTWGSPLPAFTLPTVAGDASVDAAALTGPLVVMFLCNHCPYVKAVEDRVIALAREFEGQGVTFLGICANDADHYPDDAPAALAARARSRGYGFAYLHDESQEVARAFGAVCTPEFFVYGADKRLAYRGRLDDSGRDPAKVSRRELAEALADVLAGRPVAAPQRPALGCSIKWRD